MRPFLQLHAVWHTLAAIGSYYHILFRYVNKIQILFTKSLVRSGDHNPERVTAMYLLHGVFTDQCIFRTVGTVRTVLTQN